MPLGSWCSGFGLAAARVARKSCANGRRKLALLRQEEEAGSREQEGVRREADSRVVEADSPEVAHRGAGNPDVEREIS